MPDPSIPQVVLMGLITVFIALICLIIIIVILGKIMRAVTGNKTESPAAPAPAPAPAAPAAPAPVAQPGSNQQLVAAIAAAIAEDMGEDVDHIKILSIRRV